MNYWVIFLTGLTTGGLSCLAMQGGFLASVIANQKKDEFTGSSDDTTKKRKMFDVLDILPVSMFLIAKIAVHTAFGALLGAIGSTLSLSLGVRLTFQIAAALFMVATAMNLFDAHPFFRKLSFRPPRFLERLVRNSVKGRALFTPALLGAFTLFVPCGITQAMEVLAITSGSALTGGIIMFSFVIGTAPLFTILGIATAKLSEAFRGFFQMTAALILILMALWSINGVLTVIDAPITASKVVKTLTGARSNHVQAEANIVSGIQRVQIDVLSRGYDPKALTVQSGIPVELTLASNGVYSCALEFNLRAFNISASLSPTDTKTFRFTPTKKGTYTYSCSMGMYSGTLTVI